MNSERRVARGLQVPWRNEGTFDHNVRALLQDELLSDDALCGAQRIPDRMPRRYRSDYATLIQTNVSILYRVYVLMVPNGVGKLPIFNHSLLLQC